jgi:hypothetical protein
MSEKLELHRAVRESADKYIYFLLAASGAAIGFALTQTQEATLSKSMILLALAVVFWGLSFYCGCKQLVQTSGFTFLNYELLRVRQGEHPEFPREASGLIQDYLEKMSDRLGKWGNWQFRFLITGAVLYVAWHVLEMYIRTP